MLSKIDLICISIFSREILKIFVVLIERIANWYFISLGIPIVLFDKSIIISKELLDNLPLGIE